jgi:hypothetical protein
MSEKTLTNRGFAACQHIKVDGVPCGSPAMTGQPYCYWHDTMRRRSRRLDIPTLEDPKAVQVAINRVLQALGEGSMEPGAAGKILYGLQLASTNMRQLSAAGGGPQPAPMELGSDAYLDFLALVEPERLRRALAAVEEDLELEAEPEVNAPVRSGQAPPEAA